MPGPSTTAFDVDGIGTVSPGRIRVGMRLILWSLRFLIEGQATGGLGGCSSSYSVRLRRNASHMHPSWVFLLPRLQRRGPSIMVVVEEGRLRRTNLIRPSPS